MTNIEDFDPNLLSIVKIAYKNTDVVAYSIKCITIRSINNQNIDSENPLCLIFNNVDAYIIEEINENKYLIFALTKNNKKVLEIYRKLRNEIKNQIKTINGGKSIMYKKTLSKLGLIQMMMIYLWAKS